MCPIVESIISFELAGNIQRHFIPILYPPLVLLHVIEIHSFFWFVCLYRLQPHSNFIILVSRNLFLAAWHHLAWYVLDPKLIILVV